MRFAQYVRLWNDALDPKVLFQLHKYFGIFYLKMRELVCGQVSYSIATEGGRKFEASLESRLYGSIRGVIGVHLVVCTCNKKLAHTDKIGPSPMPLLPRWNNFTTTPFLLGTLSWLSHKQRIYIFIHEYTYPPKFLGAGARPNFRRHFFIPMSSGS